MKAPGPFRQAMRCCTPNHLSFGRLALVAIKDGNVLGGAFQEISSTQLFGGRALSLCVVRVKPDETGSR